MMAVAHGSLRTPRERRSDVARPLFDLQAQNSVGPTAVAPYTVVNTARRNGDPAVPSRPLKGVGVALKTPSLSGGLRPQSV